MLWNAREEEEKAKAKAKEMVLIQNLFRALYRLDATWMEVIVVVMVDQSRWWESVTPVMRSSDNVKNWGHKKKRRNGKGEESAQEREKRVNRNNKPVQRLYHK